LDVEPAFGKSDALTLPLDFERGAFLLRFEASFVEPGCKSSRILFFGLVLTEGSRVVG